MMTEAEALKTLAREDPAVADDARTALRSLTSGGGLGAISLLRLQEFLWYGLPAGTPQSAEEHLAVTRALARLFTLAGMERYAETCASEETAQIISAYAGSRAEGVAAYSRALATSHAVPPDTDLLAWSSVMGPEERAAYDACAAAIELAVAARELKVGVSGWKGKRAALVERWLTRPANAPGMDTWLSRISAERIEEWAQGHPGERSRLARSVMPRLLEPPDLPDEPLPTLAWLLGHASDGLRLTATALHRARRWSGRRRGCSAGAPAAPRPSRRPGGTRNSTSTRCTPCAAWRSTRWARCGAAARPWC